MNEIICTCTGTSKAKIKELVQRGIDDLDKIASASGATTGCGACDATITNLLIELCDEKQERIKDHK